MTVDSWDLYEEFEERPPDPAEQRARVEVEALFREKATSVFFSRQVELRYEAAYFHWITNRVLRALESEDYISSEMTGLEFGGSIKLYWHRRHRYYKRDAKRVVELVSEHSQPQIAGALGHHAELLVLEAFATNGFSILGRNTRSFGESTWDLTDHDLDMIVSRDGVAYGVEVKNTLGYMDQDEFRVKRRLCKHLGIRPVFAVRMLPRTWALDVIREGGYAMILKWQMYPLAHKALASRVRRELELPVDSPRAIQQGTMDKFLKVHARNV